VNVSLLAEFNPREQVRARKDKKIFNSFYAPVAQLDRAPAFQRSLYGELNS